MELTQSGWVLSDDLLERCAQRAAAYDRENRFFFEDFDELREAKYLLAAVPKEFDGLGLTLPEVCHEQRRLARRSAPTCARHQYAPRRDRCGCRLMAQGRRITGLDARGSRQRRGVRLRVFGVGQ